MKAALALAACSVLAAACTPAPPAADIGRSAPSSEGVGQQPASENTPARDERRDAGTNAPGLPPEATTTTIEEPTTTTTTEPVATTVTVRRTTTTARPTTLAPVVHGEDFWYRLAMCESGAGASSSNVFQFMGGTAEKVGYYAGASYDEQRAMAIDWASRIHPNEGTTSGWPVCWWTALAGGS